MVSDHTAMHMSTVSPTSGSLSFGSKKERAEATPTGGNYFILSKTGL